MSTNLHVYLPLELFDWQLTLDAILLTLVLKYVPLEKLPWNLTPTLTSVF